MTPRLIRLVPVLTLLLPSLPAQDTPKVGFPLAKKDSSAAFVARAKNEQSFDMGGQQMDAGHEVTHDFRVAIVEAKEDGGVLAEVTIQRIRGNFTMPMMGAIEFDTQPPADGKEIADDGGGGFGMPSASTMRQAMAELAGKTFKATVAANGKVTAIDGIDAMLKAAREKAGPMGGQMLAGVLSDGALKQLVASTFGPLPKEPVAVGGTWQGEEDPRGGEQLPMQRQVTLTLEKADATTAEIKMSGTINSAPKKEEGAEAGNDETAEARRMMQEAKIENGKVAGTVVLSRQDGFVVRAESVVSMDVLAQGPMGEMAIAVKSTTTLERQDAKAEQEKAAPKAAEAAK